MATATVKNASGENNKGDAFTSFNVDDFAVPGGRDEVWRFIALRRIRGLHNGKFAPATEQDVAVEAADNVTVETVSKHDERLGTAGAPVDRVAAQAWTSMESAQIVTVPANEQIAEPISITITGKGDDVTSFGATSVHVGANAEATVVLNYRGSGTHADNVEFIVGDNANVNVIVDADWDTDAIHLSNQIVQVGRDATVRHTVVTFGGQIVRIVPRVKYTAPGGNAEMYGMYFADDGQYIENRLTVDHSVPNCRSRVLYKGALQADPTSDKPEARTCWVGDVLIRANADNTDTYETNRNLVLSDGARADAIPNLEIETGEIAGAGHAATVGRFDDEQMFYLMSRGIPKEDARRMIIRGFFNEIINHVSVESIREDLESRVIEELGVLA